jgi:peptidoglycan/LPS O-acetylase OafA/YrhL
MQTSKIYLPGLNGIRAIAAIAAIAVVASHINHRSTGFGLRELPLLDMAGYGVTMFFVLSGFLITYLLLKEKEITKTINYKFFFIRRALRIWPLYIFYLLLLVFVFGMDSFKETFLMYLFFMPNFVNLFVGEFGMLPVSKVLSEKIGHYWSLGVEEQFYILWPLLIKFLNKYLFLFICFFPILFLIIKILLKICLAPIEVQTFFHYSRFGCIEIGGLGAFIFNKNKKQLLFLNSYFIQLFCWIFLLFVASNNFYLYGIVNHEIISIITLVLIINQISAENKLINLELTVFDYLGKISFGLYIYNPIIIYLFQYNFYSIEDTLLNIIIIYISVFFLLIVVSHFSYHYFENYFLKYKSNFVKVNSFSNSKLYNIEN